MTKKIARVEVRIPPDIKEQFSDNCQNEGKNTSEVIRDFIYQKISPQKEINTNNRFAYKTGLIFLIFILSGFIYSYSKPDLNHHERLYMQFNRIDINGDGILTLNDFEKFSHKLLTKFAAKPEQHLMLQGMSAEEREIKLEKLRKKHNPLKRMNYYDINQDNMVTFEEFKSLPPLISSIKWAPFEVLDSDNNHYVTYEELYQYAYQWFEAYKVPAKNATYFTKQRMTRDVNDDNQLSLTEFKSPRTKHAL